MYEETRKEGVKQLISFPAFVYSVYFVVNHFLQYSDDSLSQSEFLL